jgi:hypothetical protein
MVNNTSGLRNKNFYPLRTPFPSLAIRHMVSSDIAFMSPEDVSNNDKIHFLKGYVKRFENDKYRSKEIGDAKLLIEKLS